MNILIMPTWYFSKEDPNAGIFTLEEALELKKHCNVSIYYPFDKEMNGGMLAREEKGILTFRSKQFVSFVPLLPKVVNLFKIIYYFRKINKSFKPDIIHAHVSTQAGFFAMWLSRIFKVPYIITEHAPRELLIYKKLDETMARDVYKNSKASIGVSKYLTNSLKDIGELQVIYNGVNAKFDYKKLDTIDDNNINIAFVGSFYNKEIKGINYLFEAIEQLKSKYDNIKLHIVGDGNFREYYEEEAKRLKIQNETIFYGHKDKNDALNIIENCKFLVSSSLVETFGLSIAEALMLGKPVVITKSGGPEEFVNEEVGIVVEKMNSEALAEGIDKMINNYCIFNKTQIINYAKNKFSQNSTITQYLEIYNNVVKERYNGKS